MGYKPQYAEAYKTKNPEALRESRRRTDLKRSYGITPEEHDALLEQQQGLCAICGCDEDSPRRRHGKLYVEHNHETGKVRGLACHRCNSGLASFGDDAELLLAAAAYLIAND